MCRLHTREERQPGSTTGHSSDMPYTTCRYGVAHDDYACARRRATGTVDLISAEDAKGMPACKVCSSAARPVCLVCRGEGSIQCPCPSGHHLCHGCLREHLFRNVTYRRGKFCEPRCPCTTTGASFDTRMLPRDLFVAWMLAVLQSETGECARNYSSIDYVVNRILTNACPHCDRPYYEFDACAAVMCDCGNWFCGLCLQPCASAHETHEHVRCCYLNQAQGDVFVATEQIEYAGHERKAAALSMYLVKMAELHGIVYSTGILSATLPYLQESGLHAVALRKIRAASRVQYIACVLLCLRHRLVEHCGCAGRFLLLFSSCFVAFYHLTGYCDWHMLPACSQLW